MSLKIITFLLAYLYFANGFEIDFPIRRLRSKCPKYWTDATHMNMGCLLFNATNAMTWPEAQNYCGNSHSSHLVEIFSREQQEFMAMKAYESELLTGDERNWWIGLTDAHSTGR